MDRSSGMLVGAKEQRLRRVPVPFHQPGTSLGEGEKQKRCERRTGHVLVQTDRGIKCKECDAEWIDYRF